jgi:putative Mg2+ transporter-C (MgtC) family protein
MQPDLTLDIVLKVVVSIVLGGIIGWQRQMAHKPAGFRTHILIVLGATSIMVTSRFVGSAFGGDPTRIASNIIVGIGFIGAGTIMKEGPTVYGLTTAATIWVAGALGLAIGAGYYALALLLTLAALLVLAMFGKLESLVLSRRIVRRYQIVGENSDRLITRIREAIAGSRSRSGLEFRRDGDRICLSFELVDFPERHEALFHDLRSMTEVAEVRSS